MLVQNFWRTRTAVLRSRRLPRECCYRTLKLGTSGVGEPHGTLDFRIASPESSDLLVTLRSFKTPRSAASLIWGKSGPVSHDVNPSERRVSALSSRRSDSKMPESRSALLPSTDIAVKKDAVSTNLHEWSQIAASTPL